VAHLAGLALARGLHELPVAHDRLAFGLTVDRPVLAVVVRLALFWGISQAGQSMTPESKARLDRYLELAGKYFDLKFSEAMCAVAILQVAYAAIRLYSRNASVHANCAALGQPSQKSAIPFCIGGELHGIATGLIVYAGSSQYAHWDEEEPRDVTKNVFRALSAAFHRDMLSDLALELSNPTINLYANEVLLVSLGWTSYDTYLTEVRSLFRVSGEERVDV